jgi:hypothetical protein
MLVPHSGQATKTTELPLPKKFTLDFSDNDLRERGLSAALSLCGIAKLASLDLRRTGGYKEGADLLWKALEPQVLQWKRAESKWAMTLEMTARGQKKNSSCSCSKRKSKKIEIEITDAQDDEDNASAARGRLGSRLSICALPSGSLRLAKITPSNDRKIAPSSPSSPSSIQKLKFNWSAGKSANKANNPTTSDSPMQDTMPVQDTTDRPRRLSQVEVNHQQREKDRMLAKKSDGVNHYLAVNLKKNVPTGLRRRSSVGKAISPDDDDDDDEEEEEEEQRLPGMDQTVGSPHSPTSPERRKVKKVKRRKVLNSDGTPKKKLNQDGSFKQRKVLYEIVTTPRGAGTIRRKVISPSSSSSPSTSSPFSSPSRKTPNSFSGGRHGSKAFGAGESEVYSNSIRKHKLKLKPVAERKPAWGAEDRRGSAGNRRGSAVRMASNLPPTKSRGSKPYVVPVGELSGLPITKLLGGRSQFLIEEQERERERLLLGGPSRVPAAPTSSGVTHMTELRLNKAGLGVVEACVLGKLLLAGAGAQLVVLDLKHNPALTVGWGEGGVMVGVIRRRLKRLVRLGNELKGLRAIADAVIAHPRIKELDLRCCALGWRGGGERNEVALAEAAENRTREWEYNYQKRRQKKRDALGGGCIASAAEVIGDCCGPSNPPPPPGPSQTCIGIMRRCWTESPVLKVLNGMPLRALSKGRVPGKRLDLSNQRLGDLELGLLLPVIEKLSITKPECLRRLDLRSNAFLLPPHADKDGAPSDRTIHMHPEPVGLTKRLFKAINGFCAPYSAANAQEETKNPTFSATADAIAARKKGQEKDAKGGKEKEEEDEEKKKSDAATAAISAASTGPAVDLTLARPPPGFVFCGVPIRRQLHKQKSMAEQLAALSKGGMGLVIGCCVNVASGRRRGVGTGAPRGQRMHGGRWHDKHGRPMTDELMIDTDNPFPLGDGIDPQDTQDTKPAFSARVRAAYRSLDTLDRLTLPWKPKPKNPN